MQKSYIIQLHTRFGSPAGWIADPTKKGLIERAAECMPWLAKTDIAKMMRSVTTDF